MPASLGYARVSTGDQDLAGQVMRLKAAGAARTFDDVTYNPAETPTRPLHGEVWVGGRRLAAPYGLRRRPGRSTGGDIEQCLFQIPAGLTVRQTN